MKTRLTLLICLFVLTPILFAQTFTELSDAPFEQLGPGTAAFADVDGDDDMDLLIAGQGVTESSIKLYTNDGLGNFSEATDAGFEDFFGVSMAFVDIDNDNDEDVMIAGTATFLSTGQPRIELYTNDGFGNFSEVIGSPLDSMFYGYGTVNFADINNDGDEDALLLTQEDVIFPSLTSYNLIVLGNDGTGTLSEINSPVFENILPTFMNVNDIDGDDDIDIFVRKDSSNFLINDGTGSFTMVNKETIENRINGIVRFADIDNDGDNDLLQTGQNYSGTVITNLYENDGLGNFSELSSDFFADIYVGDAQFADIDSDGDLDLLLTGLTEADIPIAKLYLNDGTGVFTELGDTPFEGTYLGTTALVDIDGDTDQDVFIMGLNAAQQPVTKLYRNESIAVAVQESLTEAAPLKCTIFPNPIAANMLHIKANLVATNTLSINIYDLKGTLLQQQTTTAAAGPQVFNINIGDLPKGSYLVELNNGKQQTQATFVVP